MQILSRPFDPTQKQKKTVQRRANDWLGWANTSNSTLRVSRSDGKED